MLIGAALVAMVASPRELSFALVSRARSLFLRALSQLVSARTPHSRAGEPSSEARTLPVFFVLCRNPLFCRNSRRSQCALGRCDAIAKEKQKKKKRKSGGRTPTLSAIAGGGGVLIECTTSPDTPIPTRHRDRQGASAEVGERCELSASGGGEGRSRTATMARDARGGPSGDLTDEIMASFTVGKEFHPPKSGGRETAPRPSTVRAFSQHC